MQRFQTAEVLQDDKIVAVLPDSPLGGVSSIEELRRDFKGVAEILDTWFADYKGPGVIETSGFGTVQEARETIRAASVAYERYISQKQKAR
jgi:inorganic pyrophosphatase